MRAPTHTAIQQSYKAHPSIGQGYVLDNQHSGKRFQLYVHPEQKRVIAVHRGTQGVHDFITDARLGLGNTNLKRVRFAREKQQAAEKKYQGYHITTTGHSLGGYLAYEVGKNSNEIITYNRPYLPGESNETLKLHPQLHIKEYLHAKDPISAGYLFAPPAPNTERIITDDPKLHWSFDHHSTEYYK